MKSASVAKSQPCLPTKAYLRQTACLRSGRKKILHACLNLGDFSLMASDCPPDRFQKPQGFSVTLQISDPAKAETIFNALAENGNITMPFGQTFWAKRFGMCEDQFGIPWMVNCV